MLVITDPANVHSTYLLESLLNSFRSAEKVAGAFAFASSAGVRLFTEDDSFRDVARNHSVDLVVGIDAVTNNRALDSLVAVSVEHPNVRVRAFLNPRREALYHPKFCWTKNKGGGCLIAGSGNLTEGGLLGNWEAYSVEQLNAAGIAGVESAWNDWTAKHDESLLPLDNAEVRRRAGENNVMAPEGDLPTLAAPARPPASAEDPVTTQLLPSTAAVLVAEIPSNSTRSGQVNFHLDDYVNFFGVRSGTNRLAVFRHVKGDGTMDAYERGRPPVKVKSRNFRFELAAASGVPYPKPSKGPPIGVYVRVATRTFFYRFMYPSDPEYTVLSTLLKRRVGPPARLMRTVRMTVDDLRREWPNAPFWKLPATA